MNILFLYWGKKGGGARYSLETAKALSQIPEVNLNLSVSTQCEILPEFEQLSVPTLPIETYQNILGFIKKFTLGRRNLRRQLEQYIREHKIKFVIIGMDFFWGPLIFKACRNSGAKALYVVHEPKPHPKEPLVMGLVKRFTIKRGITGADHVITLTNHVKKYIYSTYHVAESSISVIPHGIFSYVKAETPINLPPRDETINLLYFGRIEYYKGLDILLEAFQIIRKKNENVRLEIWGSGDLTPYENLINQNNNLRIENRWIDEQEIPPVFKRAHICILPYRDASQSGVVGIASDAAVPVVSTPAEGLIEQLSDTGAVFSDDFTPESLARSIENLIEEPDTYHALSESSLRYAEKLRWSNIARKFTELCGKL